MGSTSISLAVSMRMAKCEPFMSKYSGSPKGAIWSNSTVFPGKQPISSSFKGMISISKSLIMAFSPFLSEFIVVRKSYLD